MDKRILTVTVLGGLFGVAIILLFSFVIAEQFRSAPSRSSPITSIVGGQASSKRSAADQDAPPPQELRVLENTGMQPTQPAESNGLLSGLADLRVVNQTVETVEGLANGLSPVDLELKPAELLNDLHLPLGL